ncbi:hypothetical protein QCA50_010860 [Cerrena zonata]|uniref:C2H2-type domain-containing protein n=1 Tax=Cerrena zonata TaxID=2478898 RepID=A0AAW0FX27_9APHY
MTSQSNPPHHSHHDTRLPQRLRDPNNIGEHDEYTLNTIAAAAAHHSDIQATTTSLQILPPSIPSSSMANGFAGLQPQPTPPAPSSPILIPSEESDSDAKEKQMSSPTSSTSTSSKDESEDELQDKVPIKTMKCKKPQKKTRGIVTMLKFHIHPSLIVVTARKWLQKTTDTQRDPIDKDGFLKDINVQSITQEKPAVHFRQKTCDTDHFFGPQVGTQQRQHCKVNGCISSFIPEVTTLRRHMESRHKAIYYEWCRTNEFQSMLPRDVKARKEALRKDAERQQTLEGHLKVLPAKEHAIKYTEKHFREAAIEWLIGTDQPLGALDHPKFKQMLELAAAAKDGINIPT